MTDIIERLRIESRREPHEPIWRDAIDEIEALRAEVERLRTEALEEAARACEELKPLRTDAERYRWLRDKGDSITVCDYGSDGGWIPLHPENIDATIDAAMKAEQVAEQQGPEHISSPECWCEPELDYKDPETGAEVWVHKELQ